MNLKTRFQLSGMMFLEYFAWGAWYVTLGTYLGTTLKFDGPQIGLAYAAFALAAMISPFFVGMVADRFFPTERVLGFLHIIGAALLYFLASVQEFAVFYPIIVAYTLCFMPTIALTNSLSFHHMKNPDSQFPGVRVLGTIGWIVIGQSMPFFNVVEASNVPILIASASSIVLGLYCFTLPHTPPPKKGEKVTVKDVLGLDALGLMKNRQFAVLIISSMLICIPLSFYYSFANIFLNDVGMENVVRNMTYGQVSEIFFMLLMSFFLVRYGFKKVLMIGMAAWAIRYALFMYGDTSALIWMLFGGILLHGICYDFFFVTGQIYVDKKAPATVKGAAQGLITFATYGVGMFIGSWLSGVVVGAYTTQGPDGNSIYNWTDIWLVPAAASLVVLIVFTMLFKEEKESAPSTEAVGKAYEAGKTA